MVSVGEDLLAAQVFLLHGPETLLLLLGLLEHIHFFHLEGTLIHHGSRLFSIESLEVVWLDAVGGQHRLLCLRVLRHEVVIVSEFNIGALLQLLEVSGSAVSVALLLSHLRIGVLHCLLHVNAVLSVSLLRLLKQVVEVGRLVIVGCLREFLLLSVKITFAYLLVDPILLL